MCKLTRDKCLCKEITSVDQQVLSWRYPLCSVCLDDLFDTTGDTMYRASTRCTSLKHEVSINNNMTIMEGKLEAAGNFIYAVRSYLLKNYSDAQNYATDALPAASCFKTT